MNHVQIILNDLFSLMTNKVCWCANFQVHIYIYIYFFFVVENITYQYDIDWMGLQKIMIAAIQPIYWCFQLKLLWSSNFSLLSGEIIWMLLPQGDHAALLSAFSEMGLKLRLDMPEQAMEVTTVFFRTSTSAKESLVSMH